jgi:hypothetical protein
LHQFLNATLIVDGNEFKHKLKHSFNSNSEDALTWSCFDLLRNLPPTAMIAALDEIFEDAFDGNPPFSFQGGQNPQIHIGKEYRVEDNVPLPEYTEVDASIETADKVVFFEAKLYGTVNEAPPGGYNQMAKKLRVGSAWGKANDKAFYFIWLDLAPIEKIRLYDGKKDTANLFDLYKGDVVKLESALSGIPHAPTTTLQQRMGWITWASIFKAVLRGVIEAKW